MIIRGLVLVPILLFVAVSAGLAASVDEFIPEKPTTATLPEKTDQNWVWVGGSRAPSMVDGRAFLYDASGKQLGQLSTGFWFGNLLTADKRKEIITVETYFSRGTRGERTDIVSRYHPETLSPISEVVIPPKRINSVKNSGVMRLTEDERFLLAVNYTPAQSVSIIDLKDGRFVEEVETPGCSVLYTAGNRDFYAICGNGGFMQIKLGEDGHVIERRRTEKFFDPVADFLTIAASRVDDTWYFVSRQNNVYGIRMDGDTIELKTKWALGSQKERSKGWGIAGMNHTAAHEASGELYVLVRKGVPEEFEGAGSHVWVYDVVSGKRVRTIKMEEMTSSIAVNQGEQSNLYSLDFHIPVNSLFVMWIYLTKGETGITDIIRQRVNVYDARSGQHRHAMPLIPHGGFVTFVQAW